jgi:hypothetical protein
MALDRGFESLALHLQEAATALSQDDIRKRLCDALKDAYQGTGHYAYVCDIYGDDESGDVVYCLDGDWFRAPYNLGAVAGKSATASIDTENATDVVPRTVYDEEADEGDYMSAMDEAKRDGLYTDGAAPLCERFVSKSERDKASSDDFAGKGKSFPILKAGDVAAAVRSLGRAGAGNYSADTIKANIKRIAKRKGFPLPKAWQDEGDSKESMREAARFQEVGARNSAADQEKIQAVHDHSVALGASCMPSDSKESATGKEQGIRLVESAVAEVPITLREAFSAGKKIKIIAPGKGSTAFYTAEALKQAATDKIFRAGLPMRIDHPTKAEEAARPEGSVKDWGAVLSEDASWMDSYISGGKDHGPGLYSAIKPFSDHAQTIQEKGPFAGVSIRAYGEPVREGGKVVMRDGVPLLARLTAAEGADMVTKAGAGGMFLSESARAGSQTTTQQESEMDATEVKKLQESHAALEARVRKLNERAAVADAADEIRQFYTTVRVGEAVQERVTRRVLAGQVPLTESGELDKTKLKALVEAETKDECDYIAKVSGGRIVVGMGSAAGQTAQQLSEADRKAIEAEKADREAQYAGMMGFDESMRAGRGILERGAIAFDPNYNARKARGARPSLDTPATLEVSA